MKIRFTKIELHNFCGIKDDEHDFYDRTIIKGVNQSGKSTIKNAIYWVLFNKLADGSSPDGIRPHDADGKDIDMTDIVVSLTMDIDGKVVKATKTQKQNWVKDRTTQEQKFKGNVNEYDINGIPKKEKDFVEYMAQFIDLDSFLFCSNPFVFLRQDTKKRRATLFDLVCADVDVEIINANPKFDCLKSDLQDGTIDELISRSKHAVSSLKDDLKTIPARIDEVSSQIQELSAEEKTALNAERAECNAKLEQLETVTDTANELSRKIADARNQVNQFDVNVRIAQQKAEANASIEKGNLTNALAMARGAIVNLEKNIENAKERQVDITTCIKGYADSIKEIESEKFNDTNLSCPVCGSKYTKAKVDSMRKAWQESQDKKVSNLAHLSTDAEVRYHEIERDIQELQQEIGVKHEEVDRLEKELAVIENMPAPVVEVPDTTEKDNLIADIAKWESELETLNTDNGAEKQAVLNRISEIKIILDRQNTNNAYKARVEELTRLQLETSQKIANEEKMLDLLQEYQRTKIGLLTDRINEYFSVIKWVFFKEQINGGYQEVCIPTVNGTSYDGLLNHGDKLLAEIDLCMAFQKKADISCPIIIDDTESLDEWRIPQIDSQLICIRRTDDKSLIVESLS